MSTDPTKIPGIPNVPSEAPLGWRRFLEAMREAVEVRLGRRGDALDAGVTFRDLVSVGLAQLPSGSGAIGSGSTPIVAPPSPGTPVLDLTPPPAATGLTVTASLNTFLIEWDPNTYTTGGGNAFTEVWGAAYGGTGPLPTFANAVKIDSTPANLYAYPAGLGRTFHFWLVNVSVAGVRQVTPTGGTNGVSATTGKIGNTDLGNAIIEARNLATRSASLLADQTFETWTTASNRLQRLPRTDPAVPANCPRDFAAQFNSRDSVGPAESWITAFPGEQFLLTCYVNRSGAGTIDGGLVYYALDVNNSVLTVDVVGCATPGIPSTAWERVALTIQVPAGTVRFGVGPWINQPFLPSGTATMWFTGLTVEKRIDAGLVTANMIVAGSGAIGNAAIDNAAIANAAIDDAKIANLSAAKLTAGDGTIGGNLKSSNYVAGSTGWLLTPSGFLEASNATVRGGIYASVGAIGGILIGANYLRSSSWVSGSTGFNFQSDGTGQIGGISFNNTSLFSANFSLGSSIGFSLVNDGSGQIGGIRFSTTNLFSANYVLGTSGFTINNDGSAEFNNVTVRGVLAGVTGTFSGSLTASAVNAVDTINLAGNAVTVPTSASATSAVLLTLAAQTVLTSPSLDPKGGSIIVTVVIDWQAGYDGAENTSTTYYLPTFVLKRNGTTLVSWSTQMGFGGSRQTSVNAFVDTPGVASTYTVEANAPGFGGSSINPQVGRRLIVLLGARR